MSRYLYRTVSVSVPHHIYAALAPGTNYAATPAQVPVPILLPVYTKPSLEQERSEPVSYRVAAPPK
jgi:hypothetical protein